MQDHSLLGTQVGGAVAQDAVEDGALLVVFVELVLDDRFGECRAAAAKAVVLGAVHSVQELADADDRDEEFVGARVGHVAIEGNVPTLVADQDA